jgi:hypothetical protein
VRAYLEKNPSQKRAGGVGLSSSLSTMKKKKKKNKERKFNGPS